MRYAGQPLNALTTDNAESWPVGSAGSRAWRDLPMEPWDLLPDAPPWLRDRTCVPGHLYWPVGASRFAFGTYLVDEPTLNAISQATGGGRNPALLSLDDGTRRVETEMWMLPAVPLYQGPCAGLWLLVLVDERWYWLQRGGSVNLEDGVTSWASLFALIGTELDADISHSQIHPDLGYPHSSLAADCGNLALLLDRAAHAVGRRVVRAFDGSVTVQAPREAAVSVLASRNAQRGVLAGGYVRAGSVPGLFQETPAAFPASLLFLFPTEVDGAPVPTMTELEVRFADLPLADLIGVKTGDEQHRIVAGNVAEFEGDDWTNRIVLTRLASTWGAEWYRWQRRGVEAKLVGYHPWTPEGYHDLEFAHREGLYEDGGEVSTRLTRAAYEFPPPYVPPDLTGGGGAPPGSGGSLTINLTQNSVTNEGPIHWEFPGLPGRSRVGRLLLQIGPTRQQALNRDQLANKWFRITGSRPEDAQLTNTTGRQPTSVFQMTNTTVVETPRVFTTSGNIDVLNVNHNYRITIKPSVDIELRSLKFPFRLPPLPPFNIPFPPFGIPPFRPRIDGTRVNVFNGGPGTITVIHESGSASDPEDAIDTGGTDITVPPKTGIDFMYDGTLERAVIVGGSCFGPVTATGGASPTQRVRVEISYDQFTAAANNEVITLPGLSYTRHQGAANVAAWTETPWSPDGGDTWSLLFQWYNPITTLSGISLTLTDVQTADWSNYAPTFNPPGMNGDLRTDAWVVRAILATAFTNVNTAAAGKVILTYDVVDLGS